MNEITTGTRSRKPFFFEGASGHLIPTETADAIATKSERHHWRH